MWRRTLLQARLHLPRARPSLTAACQPIEHAAAVLPLAHHTLPTTPTALPSIHLVRWMATGQDGTDGASPPGESESAVAAAAVRYDMATCSTLIPTVKSHSGHDATDDAPPEHGAEEDEGGASDDDDDDDEAEPEANEGGEGSDGGQPSRPKKHIAVTREERRILSRYLPAFENKGLLDTFFRELNKLSREEYDAVTTFTKAELAGEEPLCVRVWQEDENGNPYLEEIVDDGTLDDEEFEKLLEEMHLAEDSDDSEDEDADWDLTDDDWRFIAWDNRWNRLIKFAEAPTTPPDLRAKALQLLHKVDNEYAKLRKVVETTGRFPIRDPVADPPSDTDDEDVILPELENSILAGLMGPVGMGPVRINRVRDALNAALKDKGGEGYLLEGGSDDDDSASSSDDEEVDDDEVDESWGMGEQDAVSLSSSDSSESDSDASDKEYEADSDDDDLLSSDDEYLTDFEDEGWNSDEDFWNEPLKSDEEEEEEEARLTDPGLEEFYPLFVRGTLHDKDSKRHPDKRSRTRFMVYNEYDPGRDMIPAITGPDNGLLVHPYYIDANTGHTIWGYDAVGGDIISPERNALLSDITKREMWLRHKSDPVRWSTERLARHYKIREERAIAIVTLKQREADARARGEPMMDRLQQAMDFAYGAKYSRGTNERHIVKLPVAPRFIYIDPPPGTNLRPGDFISEVELVEQDLAARQHKTMIAEFKERLEWATWKVGATLRRGVSRHKKALPRPKEGWSLVVRPLTPGQGDGYGEAFVAKPDGSRRELNSEEAYNLHRQRPRRRRKWRNVY